ncbi:MAG: phenylalanine--tRNA ligase subunit alpha, partial [Rhizobiales bacterium]|nr:phenylalanine--tRNA ligase subunit alpha [Hyphomicrobiales bacterium]
MSDLQALETEITAAIEAAGDMAALEAVRVASLGKKGSVSALMKSLGGMSPEERKEMGPKLN